MHRLKKARELVFFNWKPLVGFALLYKAASSLVFIPLLWRLFDLIMQFRGYSYLTLENIGAFLASPVTIAALVLLLILATVCAMLDISAVVFTLDQSAQKKPVRLWQVLHFSIKNALRAFLPSNILLVFVVLLLMPFLNIGLASSFLSTVSIPEFILDFLKTNAALSGLLLAITLLLSACMAKWLYAFHYFTLEGCSFWKARKKSSALSRKRRLRDLLSMLLMQSGFALAYLLFILLGMSLAVWIGKLFSEIFILRWIISTIFWMILALSLAILSALSVPMSYSCVSVLFYQHKQRLGEQIMHCSAPERKRPGQKNRLFSICKATLGCLILIGSLALGYFLCSGKLNPQIEYVRKTEVTAHRGASAFYPENTMRAFEGAKALGADWIELDVQQSKDGQLIVIHDSNFKRTTGVDANTWELTYEEIAQLDAGSFFAPAYAGEKIPLLSEVAALAKEKGMKLNIELKPTGHETDFEQSVVDIIRQSGIADACVITSQVYQVLERVKAYDSSVTTVYVMSLAYGDLNQLTAADHFSVEATNVTKSLISTVHNAGKQLYVWTVNTKDSIMKLLDLNVDNIITDDTALAKQCVYESRFSNLLEEYIKLLQ